jgi:neutral ceramidase
MEITPPLSVPYLGFSPRHSFFTGIRDPLHVRALHVAGAAGEFALVNADLIGMADTLLGKGRRFASELKEAIRRASGIPAAAILLASSHIHSTPDTLDFRPLREARGAIGWIGELRDRIVAAVGEARKNGFEARLKSGSAVFPGFSKNRRGEPCLDEEVALLVFESTDRSRRILLANYACHPVIVQVQELVSADYVGAMQRTVERELEGCDACLFLQGACGDINPSVDDSRDFRDVDSLGAALAGGILDLHRRLDESGAFEPVRCLSVSETILLPSRPLPGDAEVEDLLRETSRLKSFLDSAVSREEREESSAAIRGNEEKLARIGEGSGPFAAEIQAVRLGNSILAAIPGEPFCRMGMEIKRLAKPLRGIPVGYANGYLGYIVPPDSWRRGGYEVGLGPWSKVGPESYGIILETFSRLQSRLRKER